MSATINNFKENLAIAKDETIQLLCIIVIKNVTQVDLKIRLDFSDVESRGKYFKEEIIHIEVDEDNELVSKMEKKTEQRLVERATIS